MTPRRRRRARLPALAAAALVLVVLLAAAMVAFARAGHEVPQRGGRVVEALAVDGPLIVIPGFAETSNSRDVSSLLYRGLTRARADGRPAPELASSWVVDGAAKTFTFHLRPGLRWSDGVPITSADALYTLSVLQTDADARSTAGQAWSGVTATAPDVNTVTYTLPQSDPGFMAQTTMGLLPEHALRPRAGGNLRKVTDAPSSGPFRLARMEAGRVLLERNPHAFEPPLLDGLEFRLYDTHAQAVQALVDGDVDVFAGLTPDDARRVAGAVNRRVVQGPSFAYSELLFNQKNDVLADDHVRLAIGLAVDRQATLAGALGGYARLDDGPVPPAVSWAAIRGGEARPDRTQAGRELDAAGWKRDGARRLKDGHPLQLHLATMEGDPYSSVAAELERDLAAVGIATITQGLSQEAMLSHLQSHQFDMALTAVDNGPDPDFYVFWHSSQSGPGGFNFSGMPANQQLDQDLETARSTSDYAARGKAYLDAEKQIRDCHAAVFLYSPQALLGVRDTVKGVTLPAGGERYDAVQGWYINSVRRL